MELTRFRGHLILWMEGVRYAQIKTAVSGGFRQQMVELFHAGRSPQELSREFGCSTQTIVNWVGQAAIDAGKPGLTTAEREELARLRRQVRQLQMERDILAKATAWFAGKGDKTSIGSSNS